jgi:hypothetical protein
MQSACAILSSVPCPALPYFSTLSLKRHDFRKQVTENKKCVVIFSKLLSETFLILRIIQRNTSQMHTRLHVKCPLLFWYFNKSLIFWTYFQRTLKYQISLKSVQLEPSCSTSTDRRTDMTELIVAFRKFAKASRNVKLSLSKRCRNTGDSRRTAPHVPNVGSRWTWGVTFPSLPLYLGYPLNGSRMGAK